jgi:predicted dehydrogenase
MKIALVSLGFMGSTHARAWQKVPGATLVVVVSSDPGKLSGDLSAVRGNLAEEGGGNLDFSQVRKYPDYQSLLKDIESREIEIDAIDICLPSDQHFEAVRAALWAGKHVLAEKPLALNWESAGSLVIEAHARGLILMTGHVLRFISEYRKLAEILKEGRLGAVRSSFFRRCCGAPAWSRWLTDESRSGGAVLDLLIHDIDFCLNLFGVPKMVSAVGHMDLSRGIDWLEARLGYDDVGPAIISGGWHHPKSYPFRMEFTVVSDGGTLEYRPGERPLTLFDAGGGSEPLVGEGESDPFVSELSYFTDCARNGQQPLLCPPADSATAVRLARLLMESRELSGEEVLCRF